MKLILISLIFSSHLFAASTCGEDSRRPSDVRAIGRLYGSNPNLHCTVTMISSNCAITAGHCVNQAGAADMVEFNVPNSSSSGIKQRSELVDQYQVSKILGWNNLVSRDWAILHLSPNRESKKSAGDVQGFLKINNSPVQTFFGQDISITGYGGYGVAELDGTQQSSEGQLVRFSSLVKKEKYKPIEHNVDTESGNSGSAIILKSTNEIIGIHTNGGCTSSAENELSSGSRISGNKELAKAIQACLEY